MKRILLTLFVVFAALVFSPVATYAFDLGGYTGPVEFKFLGKGEANLVGGTGLSDGVEDAWGVGLVDSIWSDPSSGTPVKLWSYGDNNEELAFMVSGIEYNTASFSGGSGVVNSVGGLFEIYKQAKGTYVENALNRTGPTTYNSITSGSPLLKFDLVPGIITGDTVTTLNELVFLTTPIIGRGSGLGNIDTTWGDTTWANLLNSNRFANNADVLLSYTATQLNPTINGFNVGLNDPAKLTVTPEPVSAALFLLGGGVIAGFVKLRKKIS